MLQPDLLATKLHYPPPPANAIRRPRLLQRLDEGLSLNRSLTLVSAPAGFGKTSCISEWVQGLEGWTVAWLSLDAADDDPGRFFTYLIGALQKAGPGVGEQIAGVLRAGELPPGEVIGTTLINDLVASESRYLLVLDDFHAIQDIFILRVLEQLLENLPTNLHVVLITREDPPLPLARLRAGNRLTEVRAGALRFNSAETERFLNEALALSLPAADVTRLEEKTEGWIAGLQLAALSLQGSLAWHGATSAQEQEHRSRFIVSLSGSHRYILEYLTEQVLNQQPPEIRDFLLQTAILTRLNGDLCNAVTDRSDSDSVLERLFNANLFLVPLDDEGQWYRYHHLFADLLRSRQRALPEEKRADLHRRASRWFEAAGYPEEAVEHALAAKAYALVVDLLDAHALEMIRQGFARTVNRWLQAVPERWRRQSTRTDLAFAWMHLLRGAYAEAAPYLEQAEAALVKADWSEEARSGRASLYALRSLVLQMEGEPAEGERLAREALALAPKQDAHARSLAHFALASALRLMEAVPPAVDAYRKGIQQARAASNPVTEMLSTVGLAKMVFEHGQLHLAVEIAEPAIAGLERSATLPPISGVLYGILGEAHYQWHRLESARRYSRRALELSTMGGFRSGRLISRVYLSRLAQMEGDVERATHELRRAGDLVSGELPDYVWQELLSQQVRLYLARNQPDAARLALQGEGVDPLSSLDRLPGKGINHAAGLLYNSVLRLLLYEAQASGDGDQLQHGIRLADCLLAEATQREYRLVVLETLLLRAQMRTTLGAGSGVSAAAASDYGQALKLAEPEGIVGVFVEQGPPVAEALSHLHEQNRLESVKPEYVERIIRLARAQPHGPDTVLPRRTVALAEPLTEREVEVLHLIAEGLKYKEIAATLFISLNTVRYHVKAIYGKLGVNKRTQAVTRARELQIL